MNKFHYVNDLCSTRKCSSLIICGDCSGDLCLSLSSTTHKIPKLIEKVGMFSYKPVHLFQKCTGEATILSNVCNYRGSERHRSLVYTFIAQDINSYYCFVEMWSVHTVTPQNNSLAQHRGYISEL